MKKIIKILSLIMMLIVLCSCGTDKVTNEIYNVIYNGTVSIDEFEELVQGVIKSSEDSVIGVTNYAYNYGGIELQSIGTGVIYSSKAELVDSRIIDASQITDTTQVKEYQYLAITNQHVIDNNYIIKAYYNESEIIAEVVKEDAYTDLAIISFKSNYYIPSLTFGDSENIVSGSFVVAIGCSSGLEYYGSSSFGIISYPKRYIDETIGYKKVTNEYIQHDVSINPGNSGGPLINMKGEVIGINSMKLISDEIEGMGFAIPSNIVKEFIKDNE